LGIGGKRITCSLSYKSFISLIHATNQGSGFQFSVFSFLFGEILTTGTHHLHTLFSGIEVLQGVPLVERPDGGEIRAIKKMFRVPRTRAVDCQLLKFH
jgi:hypothetical protein